MRNQIHELSIDDLDEVSGGNGQSLGVEVSGGNGQSLGVHNCWSYSRDPGPDPFAGLSKALGKA